jgi:hypothetical protein
LVGSEGALCTLEHLQFAHELDPTRIKSWFVYDEPGDERASCLVVLCREFDSTRRDDFIKVLTCIRWMVVNFPFLVHMNSLFNEEFGGESYRSAPGSILAFLESGLSVCQEITQMTTQMRACVKDSLLVLNTCCCKALGVHGGSNVFIHLLSSCVEGDIGSSPSSFWQKNAVSRI